MEAEKLQRISKNVAFSLLLYATPILLMFSTLWITGERPWLSAGQAVNFGEGNTQSFRGILTLIFNHFNDWGLSLAILIMGIIEFVLGNYEKHWGRNERILDIVCFIVPKIILAPILIYFYLKFLPSALPEFSNIFSWVPFWWGFLIIAVADDLTQYWYHRLHHEVPFLWRFHRTHHSASYMGMAMASRQNMIYTIFFSQFYLMALLAFMGLGLPAIFVRGVKAIIAFASHSSVKWDKPFYEKKWLSPIAWVLERTITTPATHHAHHAKSNDDGIGHYKGNFGNMFFLWDVIFKTGIITRQYPPEYGLSYYQEEEWYAQFLWPFFKSKKEGSELSAGGPEVYEETTEVASIR